MTRTEFRKKLDEMNNFDDIQDWITNEANRLLDSGAIDLDKYEATDFGIAKTVLSSCLRALAHQYRPLSAPYTDEYENLKRF